MNRSLLPYLAASLLAIGFLLVISAMTPPIDRYKGADSDGRQYVTMAGDTVMFGARFAGYAPFAYRVATPWLASWVPAGNVIAKFRILAWVDAALILLLAYALLHTLGFGPWDSLLGMGLYGLSFWTLKFAFYSPCYIDHQTQVVLLAILLVMARGWWPLLPFMIFGGYFQKESVLAVVPVITAFFIGRRGWRWWPAYAVGMASAVAAVAARLALEGMVHPTNSELGGPLYAIQDSWGVISHTPGYPRILIVAAFSCLGVMPLLLISHLRWVLRYLWQNPAWLVMILVGVALLLGGLDKSRLFLNMLPAVVVASVALIAHLRKQLTPRRFALWLTLVLLVHAYLGAHLEPFRDFMDYLNRMVPEHSPNQGAQGFTRMFFACVIFAVGDLVLRWRTSPAIDAP